MIRILQRILILTLVPECLGDMICFDNGNRQRLDFLLFYLFQKQHAVVKLRCYSWLKRNTLAEKGSCKLKIRAFKNKTAILIFRLCTKVMITRTKYFHLYTLNVIASL